MTALSDSLAAVQARVVAALAKQYVAGSMDAETVRAHLYAIGLRDGVDAAQWLNALALIRETGGQAPGEQKPQPQSYTDRRKEEPATEPQRDRIKRDLANLVSEKEAVLVAREPTLTKAQASEIIQSIADGSFEIEKWSIPF